MCRLAIFGETGFSPLARNLNQLENSCGGDGNGYYHPASETLMRGVELTTAEIAHQAYDKPGPHLFHTRLATEGGCEDYLNHPFPLGPGAVLMHNGGWWEWDAYAYDGEESDTEAAASLVATYGPGVLLAPEFSYSGVWIVADGDDILVITRGVHTFLFQYLKNGSFFHASERVRHTKVKKTMKAEDDSVYIVSPNGSFTRTIIPTVELPEPLYIDYGLGSNNSKGYIGWPKNYTVRDYEGKWTDEEVEKFNNDLWDEYTMACEKDSTTPSWHTYKQRAYDDLDEWEELARRENLGYEDDEFTTRTPYHAE